MIISMNATVCDDINHVLQSLFHAGCLRDGDCVTAVRRLM
jgi:hypothetical protein